MLLFVDSCRTSNKNVSPGFCWKGWVTNPTEWLLNQTGLNRDTNNSSVPPLPFWPTSIPLYIPRSRSPQLAAQIALQHQASDQCVRKVTFSDSSEPALSLRETELLPATESRRRTLLYVIGDASEGIHFKLHQDWHTFEWLHLGTVRTPLGTEEASPSVPVLRTGPAGQ